MRRLPLTVGLTAALAAGTVLSTVALTAAGTGQALAATTPTARQVAYFADNGKLGTLDLASGVVTEFPLWGVNFVALAPDGAHVYATETSGKLAVVDATANTLTREIPLTTTGQPMGLTLSPDGTRAYVVPSSGPVSIIDTGSATLVGSIPQPVTANYDIAVTPDGGHVYVANPAVGTVTVSDTATSTVNATVAIGTGTHPIRLKMSPDGTQVFVTSTTGGVSIIDTATNSVTASLSIGRSAGVIAVSPDGHRVAVADNTDKLLAILDPATGTIVGTMTGMGANGLAFADASHLYATSTATISLIDVANLAVAHRWPAGAAPTSLSVGTVTPGPVEPIARLSVTATANGGSVQADASGSTRGWSSIVSYDFDFGDGTHTLSATPAAYHDYARPGAYTVSVTVTDVLGAASTASAANTVWITSGTVALLARSNLRYVNVDSATGTSLTANATTASGWAMLDIIDTGSGIVLQSHIGWYLVADTAGLLSATADSTAATVFQLIHNADGTISLRSVATNRYVSGNNGTSPLAADRTAIGPWEEFYQVAPTNLDTALRARANDMLVTAESAGTKPLIANRTAVGQWETLDIIDTGDGYVALYSQADSKFVTAESGGAKPLIANRTAIGDWEKFTLIQNADGTISLRAHANGRYVTAESAGAKSLIANRTAIGDWEKFTRTS